jgi:hypothetical protein
MATRIIVALLYAVGIVGATLTANGVPATPEAWIGLVVAFIGAFWAKFSSSTTLITPNRAGETLASHPPITL